MSSLGQALAVFGLLGVAIVHTLIAAVATRFFRLRLATDWGWMVFTAFAVPVIYVPTTIALLGALSIGDAGGLTIDQGTVIVLLWALPLALGVTLDRFWVPAPDELPQGANRRQQR